MFLSKRFLAILLLFLSLGLSLTITGFSWGQESPEYPFHINPETGKIEYNPQPIIHNVEPHQGIISQDKYKILYWVQISDIHINMQEGEEFELRRQRFDDFCNLINDTIKPAFIISSGDNVDSDEQLPFYKYYENEEEYIFLNKTLHKYGFNESFWFFMVGNHERYNSGFNLSLFLKYLRNETQYGIDVNLEFGKYRFIMLDTTQEYGILSPYCLYGEMKRSKLDNFENLINYSSNRTINQTLIFGHHPLMEISSERSTNGYSFEELIELSHSQAYFVGHLHLENLYINRKSFCELHAPSFKDRYMFRISVLHNDILSFSDVKLDSMPYIVITNPTDSRFYNENTPINKTNEDEIDCLIFSNETLLKVFATIDGNTIGDLKRSPGTNLWTLKYDPSQFLKGQHNLTIYARTNSTIKSKSISFNLEGETQPYHPLEMGWIYFTIPLHITLLTFNLLFLAIGIVRGVLPISFPITKNDKNGKRVLFKSKLKRSKNGKSNISISNRLIGLLCILYPFIGPTFIGEFKTDTLGVFTIRGLFIDGTIVYTHLSYLISLIFLIIGLNCQRLFNSEQSENKGVKSKVKRIVILNWLLILLLISIHGIYFSISGILLSPPFYLYPICMLYFQYKTSKNIKTGKSERPHSDDQMQNIQK